MTTAAVPRRLEWDQPAPADLLEHLEAPRPLLDVLAEHVATVTATRKAPPMTTATRYNQTADRADLVTCIECSTRSTVVTLPADEVAAHDAWHDEAPATGIPAGYRLAVIAPDGTLLETIDLEGADLTKPLGAQDVIDNVDNEVRAHVAYTAAPRR